MTWDLLGERRAISLLSLGFFTFIFLLMAFILGAAWARLFIALSLVYGIGFFALAAEWFWARWYAQGIGVSGITAALLGLITSGWNNGLALWGGLHLIIYLPLLGESMAERYENQQQWRQRLRLDDYGVSRLKRAIKSAATALPTLVIYALAPRQQQLSLVLLTILGFLGFWGLIRMRFWGVVLLGLAAIGVGFNVMDGLWGQPTALSTAQNLLIGVGGITVVSLCLSVSPFILPAYRWLRSPPAG